MNLYKSDKVRFISGLILIFIIYTCYYVLFEENSDLELPSKVRHIIKFLATVVVYFVGTFHLGKLTDSWMSFIWHVVHISGLTIIISLGIFDLLIGGMSLNLRAFAGSIQEALISPVLYVAMGLLNHSFKKNSHKL
ncbi:hypothetical protein ACFSKN_17260 [Mariniflexile gromovii]|uniref:Uncharacterized protein n=1 Tax=Mariniflexile gromovii TaxID=362523 RepID=A0ABS4BNU2_9FLAO|nr:hypothetical protein [Mariniflexile gromovii]MBP0902265.1 hypothetical protein [Mariniflexile gromovii]